MVLAEKHPFLPLFLLFYGSRIRLKDVYWMHSKCYFVKQVFTFYRKLALRTRKKILFYGKFCLNKGPAGVCGDITSYKAFFFTFLKTGMLCPDYVTEKFYRSLSLDVVPVVMGGADYKLKAPPHSYIDALDFQSPKHLADYLNTVASD
ncbi:unnamed protein product, partial [Meganyctiphanes norvegica]